MDLHQNKKKKHFVDHWRPVKGWTEERVWDIIRKYRIHVHPAYYLARLACYAYSEININGPLAGSSTRQDLKRCYLTKEHSHTIKRKISILYELAQSVIYSEPIILDEWTMPKGAFRVSCGPS